MKEKLTRNIGLKILSVILAVILWLFITNIDDPITEVPFDNVKVKILNEDEIKSQDKVYEILEGDYIDFKVAARRSIADYLTESDFEVTADFSKLSDVNAVVVNITCPKYGSDVKVTEGMNQVMKINPEKLIEKNFKVTVVTKGEPAQGYYVGEKTANTIITVSGPQSKMERMKEIVAEVNVSEASESFRSTEKLKALDTDEEEIDASNLTFSVNYATINVSIYKTKTINLIITTAGSPANGYAVSKVEYEPKSIEVAGKDDVLNSNSELRIEEDISGASEDIEKEINIQEQLPEGLLLAGEDQTVAVNITIVKTVTKKITIWPGDIEVRNLDTSLELTYPAAGPITVKVSGLEEELSKVSRNTLKPYIDLKGYLYGTYTVKVKADSDANYTFLDTALVNINLILKDSID